MGNHYLSLFLSLGAIRHIRLWHSLSIHYHLLLKLWQSSMIAAQLLVFGPQPFSTMLVLVCLVSSSPLTPPPMPYLGITMAWNKPKARRKERGQDQSDWVTGWVANLFSLVTSSRERSDRARIFSFIVPFPYSSGYQWPIQIEFAYLRWSHCAWSVVQ